MAIQLAPIIAAVAPWLLNMIFGGGDDPLQQQQETTTTTQPRGYQSPMLGLLDPLMMDSLLRRMQQFSGAGMPGGQGNLSPAVGDILNLLGGEWGGLLEEFGKPGIERERKGRTRRELIKAPTSAGQLRG